jgi:C4-dicarboxylate-binding protein DctP
MKLQGLALSCAALTAGLLSITTSRADEFNFLIASGNAPGLVYVNELQQFFIPEVSKRIAARTPHKVEFIESWGGSMVKLADTLEGVQAGISDFGAYRFYFEPSNLPLHAYQVMLPFGTMSAINSGKIARANYDKVPYVTKVFEDAFGEIVIGLVADNGFGLMTTFDCNTLTDLKGRKIGGADLNLKWLEFAGAVPVQVSAPEVYTAMQTGVYLGVLVPPNFAVALKWYEVAKFYKLADLGAITWQGMTINKARFGKLPQEVQDIILQAGRDFEVRMADINEADYPKQLEQMKSLGVSVSALPDTVKADWAKSLAGWPQEKATELDGKGMPASEVLRMAVAEAEKLGHKWPARYEIKAPVEEKK